MTSSESSHLLGKRHAQQPHPEERFHNGDNGDHDHMVRRSTADSSDDDDSHDLDTERHHHQHHHASVVQTIANMAKTCMGSGCLALPFAARQGGLLLHTLGLMAMMAWNVYTIQRLCSCLDYLPSSQPQSEADLEEQDSNTTTMTTITKTTTTTEIPHCLANPQRVVFVQPQRQRRRHPPEGTALFGKVVWYAVGPLGLVALDFLLLSFLFGIFVTYINAMRSFLRGTFLTTGSDLGDVLALIAMMGTMSSVPHMGYLSKASVVGLFVLAGTFGVIAIYGLSGEFRNRNDDNNDEYDPSSQHYDDSSWVENNVWNRLSIWPEDGIRSVSAWFGCICFSFGVAPLTYNFRSSMADPSQLLPAATWALGGVAMAYMLIGIGFWMLFPHLPAGDLLQVLPTTGILPVATRLAMVVVVMTTTPLLILPCGELIEGKVEQFKAKYLGAPVVPTPVVNPHPPHPSLVMTHQRVAFRFGICGLGCAISMLVPGFVNLLSFVGSCCVAFLGFCIPPLVHALLCYRARHHKAISITVLVIDVLMFGWGLFATVVSTTYTFRQLSSTTGSDQS